MSAKAPQLADKQLRFHAWRDVFVVVDTGRASRSDYQPATEAVQRQAQNYPAGIGILVVVPRNATPPAEDSRQGIEKTLADIADKIRCVCWLVEGTGFQGGMARAVLNGLRVFNRRPYPTYVSTNLQQALGWVLTHLDGGTARLPQVPDAVRAVLHSRSVMGDPSGP